MVMSGMLTAVFYARLWRRAGVMTDAEFAEIRYSGGAAAFLRGFRASYLALAVNSIIIGWVTAAMAKILGLTLGVGKWQATIGLFVLTGLYSAISGLWGVLVTDFFQFALAMAGCIALAFFALGAVGGMSGLLAALHARFPDAAPLGMVPALDSAWMPALTFFVYIAVNWWASWYPGAEPGGGGYVAQRIMSAKDERHALLAAVWFNIAHYALRPWPWIVVAVVSMVLSPGLADPESGYVRVMVDVLPPFWRGFLLAAFFAAYMSTISTQLNWGASYLVNDVYRRFWAPGRAEAHYVAVGRVATVGMMAISGVVTYYIGSVEGAWKFLLALGAGTGLVYLLRWYWWRVNAWSEVSAMTAALVVSLVAQFAFGLSADDPRGFAWLLLTTTAATTAIWLLVTFLTPPEPPERLRRFYARARPGGPGWRAIVPEARADGGLGAAYLCRAAADAPSRRGSEARVVSYWDLTCLEEIDDEHPHPGLRNQSPGPAPARRPRRRPRALPEGLADPLRGGRGTGGWLRRGRQRVPRDAGPQDDRRLRGERRGGRGPLLLRGRRRVPRHPSRRGDPVLPARVV